MFWDLFKMIMFLVTLPLKLIGAMIKIMAVVMLPIMVIKAIMHSMHK